jgi:D-glycero-D-manno-heptose 1,7-bisphosphate phosphatase
MEGAGQNKAIFLDRDGTILVEVGYLNHPSQVVPYAFAPEALRRARESGFLLIVVTNQSGVARGYIRESDLVAIHGRMHSLLAESDARLDAVYYCPHHPHGTVVDYSKRCDCRKPGIALGIEAARKFDIDLTKSYMIGDKHADVLFGENLGVYPCLVRTGYGSRDEDLVTSSGRISVFDNVLEAVDWITRKD